MFGNEQIIKLLHFRSYSKRAKNFTLPKNIITNLSLARLLCDLQCMMNKSLNPLFTLQVSAAHYSSTAPETDLLCRGKFLKRVQATLHTASLKIGA